MPSSRTSCRHLGNARACLGNTRVLLHVVAAKPFFISTARGEPWDTCQHRSQPLRRGAVRSLRTHGSARALLGGEAGSGASRHVAMLEPSLSREADSGAAMSCGSVWVHALPFVLA
jgi:hypothetical protein